MRACVAVAALATWAALAAGCGDMRKGREVAEAAVDAFHASLDQGRAGDVYDGASDEFRASMTKEEFVQLLGAVRRKLGKVTGTTNGGWRVSSRNLATYADLTQKTRFEQGEAVESFRFVVKDGKATLLAWDIRSRELVVR